MEMSSELLVIVIAVVAFVLLLIIVSLCKVYKKLGIASWKALVPFYGAYILYKIVFKNGWLAIIPVVNIVFGIILNFKLALLFGKNLFFGLGLLILPFVFYPVLAFGKARYIYSTVSVRSLNCNLDDDNSEAELKKEIVGNPMMDSLLKSNSTSNSDITDESNKDNVSTEEKSTASFVTNVSFDEEVVGDPNKVVPLMVGGKKDDDSEFSQAVASISFIPTETESIDPFKNENKSSDLDRMLLATNNNMASSEVMSNNVSAVSKNDIINANNEFSMNSVVQTVSSVNELTGSDEKEIKEENVIVSDNNVVVNDDVSLSFVAPVVEPVGQVEEVVMQPEIPPMVEEKIVTSTVHIVEQNPVVEMPNVQVTQVVPAVETTYTKSNVNSVTENVIQPDIWSLSDLTPIVKVPSVEQSPIVTESNLQEVSSSESNTGSNAE